MRRRDFIAGSYVTGLASWGALAVPAAGAEQRKKEFYELRTYYLDSPSQQEQLVGFFGEAAIPALNRAGIKPVGVFSESEGDSRNLRVLLPHQSLESVVTATSRLSADKEYLRAGAAVLDAPKANPAYARIESALMLAFDEMPKLEVHSKAESRVYQLRIYESHSVAKGQRKIEMFNSGGEIAIFRRTGLHPVFFGESLVGAKLPNLTYMLGFDNREVGKQAWDRFLADPEWKKLAADPRYKDTVSNITNTFLQPAVCSQI